MTQYKEDLDYIVEEASVTIAVAGPNGSGKQAMRQTSKIIKAFFVDEDASYYLCNTCREFRNENVNSVRSHLNRHANEEKVIKQKLAAFDLLPKAIQEKLLERAKLSERKPKAPVDKRRPGPAATVETRYGNQPVNDILLARDMTTKQLGESLGISVDALRNNFRGAHALTQNAAIRISEHLDVPMNQLFTASMMANMREDTDDA